MPVEYSQSTKLIEDAVQGCYDGQQDRIDELNTRLQSRQFSDFPLQPRFTPIPVSTKYTQVAMPTLIQNHTSCSGTAATSSGFGDMYLPHRVGANFNPGTAVAPWSGYVANVDLETQLRNQVYALQSHPAAQYAPRSDSDMFQVRIVSNPVQQKYARLFAPPDIRGALESAYLVKGKEASTLDGGGAKFSVNTRLALGDITYKSSS